jgi:Double-stranded DNA-binding domain
VSFRISVPSLTHYSPPVNRIALVNPQLSAQVESILVRMAQSGQLRGRVSEQQLIGLLDQADGQQNAATVKKGAIVVSELATPSLFLTRIVSKEKRPR